MFGKLLKSVVDAVKRNPEVAIAIATAVAPKAVAKIATKAAPIIVAALAKKNNA